MNWAIIVAFLLPVAGGLFILRYLYLRFGKDIPVRKSFVLTIDPPDDLSPSVLGAILHDDGKPKERDFIAEILYLAYKRKIDIIEDQAKKQVVLLKLSKEGLDESEKVIFGYLFKSSEQAVLSDAIRSGKRFSDCIRNWQALALKEARTYQHSHGWFHDTESSKVVRRLRDMSVMFVALVIIAVQAFAFILGPQGFNNPVSDLLYAFLFGCLVSVVPLNLFAWVIYRRTSFGSDKYQKWMDFKSSLESFFVLGSKPPSSVVIWDKLIVYAVSLGVAKNVQALVGKTSLPKSVLRTVVELPVRF